MKDHASYSYERVIVTGRLVTKGNLHVGSGFEETNPRSDDLGETAYGSICLDAAGEPYIPASTLRGLLCRVLAQLPEEHGRLCGTGRQALDQGVREEQRSEGNAGALRLYDARWVQEQPFEQRLEQRVALDPVTRTAGDHLLFTDALIPPGAELHCRFELDRVDRDDLCAILTALRALGDTSGIGAGRSRTQGGLQWVGERERVQILSRERFLDWLRLDHVEPLGRYFDHENNSRATYGAPPGWEGAGAEVSTIETLIRPTSPLLVSPKRGESLGGEPDLVFRQDGERVSVPASSLKGMLRAQCRRILLTRLGSDNATVGDPILFDKRRISVAQDMVDFIFGSADAAARLHIGDAQGPFTRDDEHRQFFNAVDRFTGGVAEHRLYNVVAVMPKELSWPLVLQPALLHPDAAWARGLLCYVLRDAMEGDLSIGWGRARGYGAFRLALKLSADHVLSDWTEVPRQLAEGGLDVDQADAETWLGALDTELDERMRATAPVTDGGDRQ